MKNIERFYRTADGSPPIIGNGVELWNARGRSKPTHSYHVLNAVTREEIAIRYPRPDENVIVYKPGEMIELRPILSEVSPACS